MRFVGKTSAHTRSVAVWTHWRVFAIMTDLVCVNQLWGFLLYVCGSIGLQLTTDCASRFASRRDCCIRVVSVFHMIVFLQLFYSGFRYCLLVLLFCLLPAYVRFPFSSLAITCYLNAKFINCVSCAHWMLTFVDVHVRMCRCNWMIYMVLCCVCVLNKFSLRTYT